MSDNDCHASVLRLFQAIPPDTRGFDTPRHRARCAAMAKVALVSIFGADLDEVEGPENGIADLLADLRHLCDTLGVDFVALLCRGQSNYLEEKGEDVLAASEELANRVGKPEISYDRDSKSFRKDGDLITFNEARERWDSVDSDWTAGAFIAMRDLVGTHNADERNITGVLGADGSCYSDADPGL